MNQNDVNILTKKKYYPIYSTITGRLYMDEAKRCYLFEAEQYAKMFCRQVPGCAYRPAEYIKPAQFCTVCNTLGIKVICIKLSVSNGFDELSVLPTDGKRQHYNAYAMKRLLLLKTTKKRKYLAELDKAKFIAPLIIRSRQPKEYPTIHYATATLGNYTFLPLFTTVQEFEHWKEKAKVPFVPHETTLLELSNARKNLPVIVNMEDDRFVLTDEMLKMIECAQE